MKALKEDLRPGGDITTNLINSKNKIIKAKIIAKQDGIIAGLEFCKAAFQLIGSCLLYTSPSPRDISGSRMPSSA